MITLIATAAAATLTVGTDADTLQAALDAAGPDDTISLPAGTHSGCVTSGGTVTIEGAGPSRTTIRSEGCETGLAHTGGELSITGVNLVSPGGRALSITAATAALLDVTVRDSGGPRLTGGGVYLKDSDTTLTNARLTNNRAERGGALHVEGGSLSATGVVLADNTAQFGGAISARGRARVSLSICQLTNNLAAEKGYGKGGAFYGFGGVTLEDDGSTFADNRAAVYGGAVLLERDGGALTLHSTTLKNNRIQDDSIAESSGGAVFADAIGSVTLTDVTLTDNAAFLYGGAIYLGRLKQGATITDATFRNNRVQSKRGGAIAVNDSAEVHISGGSFVDNHAAEGGGAISLYNSSGRLTDGARLENNRSTSTRDAFGGGVFAFSEREHTLTLDGVELVRNSAALSGGGVYAAGLSALRVVNTTLTDNSASDDPGPDRYFGGGIAAHQIPSVALSGSTVCGNRADEGLAIHLSEVPTASVVRSTIAADTAEAAGLVSGGELILSDVSRDCP